MGAYGVDAHESVSFTLVRWRECKKVWRGCRVVDTVLKLRRVLVRRIKHGILVTWEIVQLWVALLGRIAEVLGR